MNLIRNKKRISLLLIVIPLLFLSTIGILAISKEECKSGRGEWKFVEISSPDEPDFVKKELKPYCECEIGFYWNESSKRCENDSEIRCLQTQGIWKNGECECPEGTIKWTSGFGCDREGPVPLGDNYSNKDATSKLVILGILITLLIIGYFLYKYKRRKRD